jgi:hypothetical protein
VYRKIAFFLLIPIFVFLFIGLTRADTCLKPDTSESGKTLLIVIDRIGLADLLQADTPNIDALLEKGGVALMTTNTGGSRSQRDAYLTMGAGTRVAASDKSPLAFQVDENFQGNKASDLYFQMTGFHPPENAIVNLGFVQTVRNNNRRPYTVNIGALGTALRNAGIRSAVIGNCDTPGENKRYLVSLMMDDQGIVPAGYLDRSFLITDYSRPFGIRTDYNKLMQYVDQLWDTTHVFAIQLGDTSRAEDFRYEATDAMNEHYKRTAIEESDAFIGNLIKRINWEQDRILIVTPLNPASDLAENNRLTPVIMAGHGITKGLLSSGSTQRAGIITNLDIGATILSSYNIPAYGGQLGARIYPTTKKMEVSELLEYNIRLKEVHNQRTPLLRSYVAAIIILLTASLTSIFLFRKLIAQACVFLQFIMAVPIAYLLLPLFHQPTFIVSMLLSWLLAVAITGLIGVWKQKTLIKTGALCTVIIILLIADQLTGEHLISHSPLGYDIISGVRFYGIGNEYMGILIGAVCTGAGVVCELWSRKNRAGSIWFIFPIFLVCILLLAHPGLGANVGGTISILAAFASFVILNWHGKIRLWHIMAVGFTTALFILMLFLFDSSRPVDSQSHMGQTLLLIRQNGIPELFLIAKRKIEVNLRLFRYTVWTRVFLLSLLSMVLLLFRPVGIFRDIANNNPYFVKGIASGVIGCITALLVNDSGIVAAGTSMIFIAPPALLVVINYLPDRKNKPVRKENCQ